MIHVYTCPHHGAVVWHAELSAGWIAVSPRICPLVIESGLRCGKTLTHSVQVGGAR